jgi:hypothetical protein
MHSDTHGGGHPGTAETAEKIERIMELEEELEEAILELIEIEEHAASGKRKPRGRRYAFRVGKERFEVTDPTITGKQVLEKAGKTPPEKYILRQVEHGGTLEIIELTTEVDLRAPGVERFRAMPRTAQDG